jgi:hypothetical protein
MKMTAPIGVTGHVMCSGSGQSYYIVDGQIEVNEADFGDLLAAGFSANDVARPVPKPVASTFAQTPRDDAA